MGRVGDGGGVGKSSRDLVMDLDLVLCNLFVRWLVFLKVRLKGLWRFLVGVASSFSVLCWKFLVGFVNRYC